jgi:hypothetical protein
MFDEFDRANFLIEYPVFVLSNEEGGVMVLSGTTGRYLPLFTDTDTAEQFLWDSPISDFVAVEITTLDELRRIIFSAERGGIDLIAIDPEATGKRKAVTFTLIHFVSCLCQKGAESAIELTESTRFPDPDE